MVRITCCALVMARAGKKGIEKRLYNYPNSDRLKTMLQKMNFSTITLRIS